jgi:ferredoxin
MPWVNQDLCIGCSICVDECPVDAITQQENRKAVINDDLCIRCGKCHDVCPQDAVRHDSERIPQEIEANLTKTRYLLKYFETPQEQYQFCERMIRYFNKEKKVAETTIDKIKDIKNTIGREEPNKA